MTDDTAARLRALATESLSTVKGRFDLAMEGDAILALLDRVDFLQRNVHILVQQRDNALSERDAAMALLKKHGIDYEP